MGQDVEAGGSSSGQKSSPKDKASFSSTSKSHKLQDKVSALRPLVNPDSAHVRHSCSLKISRNHTPRGRCQRECRGVDELVKYMSEVPAYLQLLERGNTNQEKALNMGVLDWGHLQKWTVCQRPLKTQYETNFPSSCSIPSSWGSSGSSNTNKTKQYPSLQSCQSLSVDKKCNKHEVCKRSSQQLANFLSSKISKNTPEVHQQPHTLGLIKEIIHRNNTNSCGEKFNSSASDGSTCSSQEVNTSLSTSSECEIPCSSEIKEKDLGSILRSRHVQVFDCDQLTCRHDCLCTQYEIQTPSTSNSQCFDGQPIYQQDVPNGGPRFSLDSAISKNEVRASDGVYFSGILSEDVSFTALYSDVPHSCPLPSNSDGCGWPYTILFTSGNHMGASPYTSHIPAQVDVPQTLRSRCSPEKSDNITSLTPELIKTRTADSVPEDVMEATTAKARETLHDLSWVIRSSSLKEIQVRKPSKGTVLPGDDKTVATSRARRSPLRRLLDPLLKPRMSIHYPESSVNSPASFVRKLSFSDKLRPKKETLVKDRQVASAKDSISSAGQEERRLTFSSRTCESRSALKDERHERSKMQALLRLSWKNDLPLFTFSMNDNDILVATRKSISSEKKDAECTYTFYYVRENNKKSGGWRNQGSKTKRQELISKVVGRMNVSHAQLSEPTINTSATQFLAKEFVLYGSEIRPTASQTPQFLPESEIAAIVVRSPKVSTDSCSVSPLPKYNCSVLRSEDCNKNVCISSSIVAILPREVHGLSEAGGPSPLIERWKSGGSCDCGGWDVGCSLAILTENIRESCMSRVDRCLCATANTHRTELIIQGGSKKNSPVFSLVPFNEGLFTVDFDESISMLQAFFLCIAILHRRKPSAPSKLQTLNQQMFTGDIPLKHLAVTHGKAPATYVPYCPPLSPVGRA